MRETISLRDETGPGDPQGVASDFVPLPAIMIFETVMSCPFISPVSITV
jgi:hypothetical protein